MKVTLQQLGAAGYLIGLGYSPSGACAFVGNFSREVGPTLPGAFRRTRLDHGSQGLPQWRLDRLVSYCNFVKQRLGSKLDELSPDELWAQYGRVDFQLDYVDRELRTDYPKLREKLVAGGDVAALTADVCWQYERPNRALSGIEDRIAYARATLDAMNRKKTGSEPVHKGNVVDHLQGAVDTRAEQQKGGVVLAAAGGVGGLSLAAQQLSQSMPAWEIAAIAVCLVAIVGGALGAISAAHKAATLRQAVANVTGFAPAADDVDHTPVEPPMPSPVKPDPRPDFDATVAAEVKRQLDALLKGAQGLPAQGSNVDPLHPANFGSDPGLAGQQAKAPDGMSFTIGRADVQTKQEPVS